MNKQSLHSLMTIFLLVGACVMGYLLYQKNKGPDVVDQPAKGLLKTEKQFRDKLTSLRIDREKSQNNLTRLERLKARTMRQLKEKGIKSGADYKKSTDSDVKYAVVNLKEWATQITKVEKELSYYDNAINGIRVMLDKFERERINKSTGLSEEESFELQKIIIDLDERLKVETDILKEDELAELLDLEMIEKDK